LYVQQTMQTIKMLPAAPSPFLPLLLMHLVAGAEVKTHVKQVSCNLNLGLSIIRRKHSIGHQDQCHRQCA